MRRLLLFIYSLILLLPVLSFAQVPLLIGEQKSLMDRHTFGWLETVKLLPDVVIARAKLDSSSEFSKIHGRSSKTFSREGRRWVRFKLEMKTGQRVTIEKPVTRLARIKQVTGEVVKLPVISWGMCIGTVYMEVDFAIDEEVVEDYQLILGRDFLAGHAYVDPSAIYTTSPNCTFEGPLHYSDERYEGKPASRG